MIPQQSCSGLALALATNLQGETIAGKKKQRNPFQRAQSCKERKILMAPTRPKYFLSNLQSSTMDTVV
jgi:hypothetical protein